MNSTCQLLKTASFAFLISLMMVAFSLDIMAQCTENTALALPATYINAPLTGGGAFNLIVNGNYTSGDGIVEGRLAVGGNFALTSAVESVGLTIGLDGNTSATTDNFIVQGNFQNGGASDIRVRGNFQYNTVQSGSTLPIHNVGEGTNQNNVNLIDFAGAKVYYQNLSNSLSSTTQTPGATYNVNAKDLLTLTGTGAVANYTFNVTLPLNNLSGVKFVNIPDGSTININISNTTVVVSPVTGSVPMDNFYVTKTIFNFPNAVNLLISDFNVQGSVLAPKTVLISQNGKVYGSVYIGSNINQAVGFQVLKGCTFNALPVRLSSLKGRVLEEVISIQWKTVSESNSDLFEIQKSRDGKNWNSIGALAAGNNSAAELNYEFQDVRPWNGENLFRLKMIDLDQTFSYSRVVNVQFEGNSQFYTYPNPVSNRLYFNNEILSSAQMLEIIDSNGNQKYQTNSLEESIDVSNWVKGLYIIRYKTQLGSVHSNKLVIK